MSAILWGVLGAVVAVVALGAAYAVGMRFALMLNRDDADECENVEDSLSDELQDSLNATVERAAADRIADAQKIANTMENAANVLLEAARTETNAANALKAATEQGRRLEEAVGLLRQVCESIDGQQGGILTALINSGLMQQHDIAATRMRQRGEPDADNPPPLMEAGGRDPLAGILR